MTDLADPAPSGLAPSLPPDLAPASSADDALCGRRSVRAFLPTPVPQSTVEALLALASRSASGSNIQPWKVTVP